MQSQDRSGYFVRLGTTVTTDTPTRYGDEEELPAPRKPRRRTSFRLRPLTVIGLVLLGWLAWAATTPGGVNARLESISDRIQNLVNDATTDPGLKRAANYYNQRYTQEGAYPKVVAADLRDDPPGPRPGRAQESSHPFRPRGLWTDCGPTRCSDSSRRS